MRYRISIWVAASSIAFICSCGGCDEETGEGSDRPDGSEVTDGAVDSTGDMGSPTDTPKSDTKGSDVPVGDGGEDSGPCGSRTECGGSCVDTSSNRDHCGACGNQCSGSRICVEGSCECPRYHEECGGTCVATNLNGDHCGGCQNACSGEKACAGGQCAESCPRGLEKCGNDCVDPQVDSDNCGGCGDSCASGKTCSFGSCVDPISVGSSPAKCRGGGPPVEVDFGGNAGTKCTGNVARTTFRWAICSCDDVDLANKVLTDAYDSTRGPYRPGGYGGSIGTNGHLFTKNESRIWGSVWTSSSQGWETGNEARVKQQLHSGGNVEFVNETHVRGEAFVDGDVTGQGPTTFYSKLHLPQSASIANSVTAQSGVSRQSVSVSKVCTRCQAGRRIPVGRIVQNHAGSNNDNAAINLDPDALKDPGDEPMLVLPCGKYYLNGAQVDGELTILATGRTALFIDGDLVTQNDVTIKPTPSAELDVFVSGKVDIGNKIWLGSPAYPASTRLFVGGSEGWIQRNEGTIGGYIYSVPGGIDAKNHFRVYGGVYAQKLNVENDVRVHFDREVLSVGRQCPDPGPGGGEPAGDAGMDGGSDGGFDADGGGSSGVCSEKGESCGDDGDCCSPLVCDGGTCGATSCNVLYESCSGDSDCCSGTCAGSGSSAICVSG